MDILIDNKNLLTVFGITVLDYSKALGFASEREDDRTWRDKSGYERNRVNMRFEAKDFTMKCLVKATSTLEAYEKVKTLVNYFFSKGVVVLSFRETNTGYRECMLVRRSNVLSSEINIRQQNSLYVFNLGLQEINPNAVKFKTSIIGNSVTINYTKGQNAPIFWGDGSSDIVSNSGNYTKNDYSASTGMVDIIIDIDNSFSDIISLVANFAADVVSGFKPTEVTFTDTSTGSISLWAWDFGDGTISALQNPKHTYTEAGTYTVTLQIFNAVGGYSIEEKINYITIVPAMGLIIGDDSFGLINDSDSIGLIN